jgi:hypothetical protein
MLEKEFLTLVKNSFPVQLILIGFSDKNVC